MRPLTTAFATAVLFLLASNWLVGQSTPSGQRPASVAQALIAQAQSRGRVKVIVGLDVTASPEHLLSASGRVAQRARIQAAQDGVLQDLQGLVVEHVKRFRYTPGIAMEVDAAALQRLAAHAQVRYVVEDRVLRPSLAESAPLIGAPQAWASGYTGTGQAVAILDTGVDSTHPFLGGRVVAEACFSSTTSSATALCTSGSTAPGAATPCTGGACDHGTHVAGIAAGSGTLGGVFMRGIAPDASIIAVQVFSKDNAGGVGAYSSDIDLALEYVYSLRNAYSIAAVNLSLGAGIYSGACDSADPEMATDIQNLRSAGIATVVAAGNDGAVTGLSFPACMSGAISVGSTRDGSDGAVPVNSVSSFSNSSSLLSLWAPGEWITSSIPVFSGSYATYAGTSMAAPHVTGAWAVLKSKNAAVTVDTALATLRSTGLPITDPGNGITRPRIDIGQAVAALAPLCTYAINPASVSISAAAADGTMFVTTPPGCAWSAIGSANISFQNGSGRIGGGALPFSVTANTTAGARTSTATVAGLTFTVVQAAPCTFSLNVASVAATAAGATGSVNVTTQGGCAWSAISSAPALSFANGTGRIGSGSATYTVAPSFSILTRTATATIAGLPFSVVESGAAANTSLTAREATRADFNGDGRSDLLWENIATGDLALWFFNSDRVSWTPASITQIVRDPNWRVAGTGDFNGDGKPDIVWRHELTGALYLWYMDGVNKIGDAAFSASQGTDTRWRIVGVGDFNGDGKPDLVWQHDTGWLNIWLMDGTTLLQSVDPTPNRVLDARWRIVGVADLNGDGASDLVFRNSGTGELAGWIMSGTTRSAYLPFSPPAILDLSWRLAAVVDLNGDQTPDFVWHHDTSGAIVVWYMNGTLRDGYWVLPVATQPTWKLMGPK